MFRYVGSSTLRAFVLKGNSLPFYDGLPEEMDQSLAENKLRKAN